MRSEWVKSRRNDAAPTQMFYARGGIITPEMEYVAQIEGLSPETVRDEVGQDDNPREYKSPKFSADGYRPRGKD